MVLRNTLERLSYDSKYLVCTEIKKQVQEKKSQLEISVFFTKNSKISEILMTYILFFIPQILNEVCIFNVNILQEVSQAAHLDTIKKKIVIIVKRFIGHMFYQSFKKAKYFF